MASNTSNSLRGPHRTGAATGARLLAGFLVLAGLIAAPRFAGTQTDVRIGVQASGSMKSPLLLASFRGGGAANDAREVVRGDFELSGLFVVSDVPALDGKLSPDPSQQGTVRVEGIVAPAPGGWTFTGEALDLGTAESVFRRSYTFDRATLRATLHRFSDDVIEALTGERGICETKVAYVRQTGKVKEIWVMDYDGHNQRQLTHDRSLALSPAWAPWGNEIAFTTFKRGNPDLYLFDLKRGASYPFSTRPGLNTAPSYSPDGKWIACTISRDGNAEIYLVSRDAQSARRLTRNPRIDSSPCFSPTGREIVFTSDRSGSPQVYLMDSEGVNQRLLTMEGKYNDSPQWSPKGDQIAYASRHDGVFDIVVMESNGQNPIQITSDAGHNENPRWSADGRKIYFSSSRSGKRQIYFMNSDGSDVVQLTRNDDCFNPAAGPRPRRAAAAKAG
ncbi:MAG TPA: Tol-Pal system beta propeller repeat protein TolB [Candidatus Eisenbacteria bacterium]|nr:Tol-Pal system beta propeller repeat protein TolB [Candidatus Eisenbacteria bacterium]